MSSIPITANITCGNEKAQVQLYPEDFKLAEFEHWLRNRFNIAKSSVIFKDNKGTECIPTKHYFMKNTDLIVVLQSEKASSTVKTFDKDAYINFHIPIAIGVIAILVYIFQHPGIVPYLATIEAQVKENGYFLKKEVILESLINGLGWALMHLFIRRMLNPENTGKWFDGYFLDSCYGGLAAFGQTLFKGFFLVTIIRKHAST